MSNTTSIRKTILAVAVFYLFGLALNGSALYDSFKDMPYGPQRSMLLTLATPLNLICTSLGLDRPRKAIASTAGAALNRQD